MAQPVQRMVAAVVAVVSAVVIVCCQRHRTAQSWELSVHWQLQRASCVGMIRGPSASACAEVRGIRDYCGVIQWAPLPKEVQRLRCRAVAASREARGLAERAQQIGDDNATINISAFIPLSCPVLSCPGRSASLLLGRTG